MRTYWGESEGTGGNQEESDDGYGGGDDDVGGYPDSDASTVARPINPEPAMPITPAEPVPVRAEAAESPSPAATEATSPASIPEKISPGSSTDRASPASSADGVGAAEAPSKDPMPPPPVPNKPGVQALVKLRIKELELLSLPINLPSFYLNWGGSRLLRDCLCVFPLLEPSAEATLGIEEGK